MREFLRPWLSEFQWFRRWHGGRWQRAYIDLNLTRNPLWLTGWDRPGCGLWWCEREDWGTADQPSVCPGCGDRFYDAKREACGNRDCAMFKPLRAADSTPVCSTHPDAPHGFDRNASHTEDRYVCRCEGWEQTDTDPASAAKGKK